MLCSDHQALPGCGEEFAFVTQLNFVRKINEILVKISVTLLRAQIVPDQNTTKNLNIIYSLDP